MKKFFKIFGLVLAGIFGLLVVAVAVAAITGAFSEKKVNIQQLSWAQDKMTVVDDFTATINFLPENANQLDVELKFVYADGADIVEIPERVKAGEEFTIKVKKDENENNIGGEVVISAQTSLVKTQTNLKILVDVPIPSDGLLIASDYDSEDEQNIINAGASDFNLYVYTNPNLALNSNTGKEIDLLKSFKDVEIKSGDSSVLEILNNGVATQTEMFYCPHYMENILAGNGKKEHVAHAPFTETRECDYCDTEKTKVLVYKVKAKSSSKAPVIVTAKALRTYAMQDNYVDINDDKYKNSEGVLDSEGRQEFFNDLSEYVNEFKDYIVTDTRVKYNEINTDHVEYASGKAFIDSVTQTNSNGETYIKINDNGTEYNAALFYLFVESRTLFNVKEIAIDKIESSLNNTGEKIEFGLHDEVQQFTVDDLKNIFKISLIPTNTDDFSSADLEYRMREIKIITIKDKEEGSESPFNFDYCGYVFEIENPSNIANPVWKIRAINPISSTDKNVRLRFYVPTSATGEFSSNDPFVDIGVTIFENSVSEFELVTTGENALATKMILNKENTNGYSYRQELNSLRYVLNGADGSLPTYNTVKFFVTKDSAKTKLDGADTTYFKIKLQNGTEAPQLKTMPYGATSVEAYEISYEVAGKNYIEALNVTNGDTLEVFAAVIKTDHNGNPVDANGVSMGQEGYNGNYVLIATTNEIEISIDYYLENLNFYTVDNSENPTVFTLRNVPETGESQQTDTIQLLANQSYKIFASPFYLNAGGEFDTNNTAYSNTEIDYKTNLSWAVNYAASTNNFIEFRSNSTDVQIPLTPFDNKNYRFEINIDAEIDKSASYGHVTDAFDFRAYGSGDIATTFSSSRSTINMIVNYAKIDEFYLNTTTDVDGGNKDYYVLTPTIQSLTGDEGSVIKWRDEQNSTIDFEINHEYLLDIQKTTEENGVTKYNAKIDKSFASAEYLQNYINLITNVETADVIKIEWKLEFDYLDGYETVDGQQISGSVPKGAKVEDYLTIEEEIYEDNGVKKLKPKLTIKKGEKEGIFIKATCTISLYKTNSGYIDYKSSVINLVLKQSDVTFEFYSPKTIESHDALIANNPGVNDAFIMLGGGNDGSIAEGYNLLKSYGTKDSPLKVYKRAQGTADPDGYVEVIDDITGAQKTAYKLINVILGADGELAGFCTYSIDGGETNGAVYFKDELGNKVYSATPTKKGDDFELILYAEYISSEKGATITVTSPFGIQSEIYYHVYVKSSIDLEAPTSDIKTKITDDNNGKIDLSSQFKAIKDGVQLKTSFEIINGGIYAHMENAGAETITLTNGEQKTLYTMFVPHNVYTSQTVNLKMYYYLPQVVNGKTVYTENSVTSINKQIAVLVENGYEITISNDIQSSSSPTISIYSGQSTAGQSKGYNFFEEFKNSPDDFIKIKNIKTGQYLAGDELLTALKTLISLSFDENSIPEAEKPTFDSLFASSSDKNEIEKGVLNTQSISSNIVVPININFKDGSVNEDSSEYLVSKIVTFYVEVKASVVFVQNDSPEGEYKTNEIVIDNKPISNTKIGHEFKNINIDTDNDGVINLGEYKVVLFDYSQPNNIIELQGTDNQELLDKTYQSYALYKFNSTDLNYKLVEQDENVAVEVTSEQSSLTNLTLNIKNAVNEISYYKLSLKTSINKENETYDYYFTLIPYYQLKTNYPLVDGPEKVTPNIEVDLLTGFINKLDRIQIYSVDENIQYVYDYTTLEGNQYQLTTTKPELNKTFVLPENQTPITFSIVKGNSAVIQNGKVRFTVPTNSTEEIVVRATLFNGAYIDYNFLLHQQLNAPQINVTQNVKDYAGNTINILEYVNVASAPENFKFIIKYNSYDTVKARINTFDGSNELDDSNAIIDYSNNELLVEFDDVKMETRVQFSIWHNYYVSGNSGVILNITLMPNLQVQVNSNIKNLVAGVETDIITTGDNSWLKIANLTQQEMQNLTVKVSKVADNITTDGNYEALLQDYDQDTNNLGIVITENKNLLKYTFKSNNTGVYRVIRLTITKKVTSGSEEFEYSYEFDINLAPNININSSYTSGDHFAITGAAGSETAGKAIVLNSQNNVFDPKDFSGNQLVIYKDEGSGNNGGVTLSAEFCDVKGDVLQSQPSGFGIGLVDSTLTLTVSSVNNIKNIYIKFVAYWPNSVENYERIIAIDVMPNIITTGSDSHTVQYSSGSSLTVFAGSKIDLNFDNTVVLEQNSNTATIIAKQNNISNQSVNANIVFNKSDVSPYYEFGTDDGNYIFFKGVSSVQTIQIPYYYDLTGKVKGIKTQEEVDFNNPELLYNPNRTISITIQPSVKELTYKAEQHNTSETAIDITPQFVNIYTEDGFKKNNADNDFNIDHVNDYGNKKLDVNQFNIIELFNFTPVDNVTFASDEGKVKVNLESLYSTFNYTVTGRLGNTVSRDGQWSVIAEATKYYTINKETGVITFIPPAGSTGKNIMELTFNISLPGVSVGQTKQTVVFKIQFAGTYSYGEDPNKVTGTIGNGTEIVDSYYFVTARPNDTSDPQYKNYGIDLNKKDGTQYVQSYNLNEKFFIGYLLRSNTKDDISNNAETYYSDEHIYYVSRASNHTGYYYYHLSNVELTFTLEADSVDYAEIDENNNLIPYVFYEKEGQAQERIINLTVAAGSLSRNVSIHVYPRKVTHNFEYDNKTKKFTAELIANKQSVVTNSNVITIDKGTFTDEEYNMFNSWLSVENGIYSFNPDLNMLEKEVTITFVNTIIVGQGSLSQDFNKSYELPLTPKVGLKFEKSNGVEINMTGNDTEYLVVSANGSRLFTSNVFDTIVMNGLNATNINVKLIETSEDVNYSDFVTVSVGAVNPDETLKTYNIVSGAKLNFKAKQLLVNEILPYQIVVSFTINSKVYTLTENVEIIILANAGLTNLKNEYTISGLNSDATNAILNLSADNVQQIGEGQISLEVQTQNLSVMGTCNADQDTINTLIVLTLNKDSSDPSLVNDIQINFANLLSYDNGKATRLNSFDIKVYYIANEVKTEIKTITIKLEYNY